MNFDEENELVINPTAEDLTLRVGDIGSFQFGKCHLCGKDGSDVSDGIFGYHSKCTECPGCHSAFTMQYLSVNPRILRCLNCLHRWEVEYEL